VKPLPREWAWKNQQGKNTLLSLTLVWHRGDTRGVALHCNANINFTITTITQIIYKEQTRQKTKWATFMYCGKEVRQITKLFKDTQLKIAFRTRNMINNILKHHESTEKYNNRGIYRMKCLGCPLKYIGQTGRTFNIRYKEHIQAIRNNNGNSGYSNHILNVGQGVGARRRGVPWSSWLGVGREADNLTP
jgi:hypothetical protein